MEPILRDLRRANNGKAVHPGDPPERSSPRRTVARSTGHFRLADGSLLRVDFELGRWVGRLYTPQMKLKNQILGTDAEVHAWAHAVSSG